MTTENKTLADILAGVHTRRDLKRFFHDTCGLSIVEAAAKLAEIERDGTPEEKKELTRADMARGFKADRVKNEARMKYLRAVCWQAAEKEAWNTPGARQGYGIGPGCFLKDEVLDTILNRMAAELAYDLDACKMRDELEAKLVRLEWPDEQVREYLDEYGTP